MTRFTARNSSAATLKSSREDVWKALTDPELLPKLTPYLHRIDVDGDRWTWHVAKVPMLGKSIGTTFTEVMTFEEPHRIGFTHDKERTEEHSAVEGEYLLEEAGEGCRVSIDIGVTVELPFAKVTRRAVEGGMRAVMAADGSALRLQPAPPPGGVSRADPRPRRDRLRRLPGGARPAGGRATRSSPPRPPMPDPDRFAWGDDVDWVRCDVTDGDAVRLALTDVEGVCYLVHSLERADRSRTGTALGAEMVRDAVARERRTPRRLPLRPRAGRPGRGALAAHLLAPRGRADPRPGHVGRPHRARRCGRAS